MLTKSKLTSSALTGPSQMGVGRNRPWMKYGWAAVVGISVGIAGATLSVQRFSSPQSAVVVAPPPYIVPVNSTSPRFAAAEEHADTTAESSDSARIEQLKTRNRRLEALVSVLRLRAANRQ